MAEKAVRRLKKFVITLTFVYCPRRDEVIDAYACNYCEHKAGEEWDAILCKYVKEGGEA
ncbi:MAG: hypothetical protein JRD89_12420 [Deltaproteobacteria bacterium]|nr:hypothetical protein [Deltaproteobacteria bacterium]